MTSLIANVNTKRRLGIPPKKKNNIGRIADARFDATLSWRNFMKYHVKTILAAVLAGSTTLVLNAASDDPSASSSSSLNSASLSENQQSIAKEPAGAQSSGGQMLLDQLPKQVQKAMLQHSGGANPENIRQTTQNGQQCYTATFDRAGTKGKMTVGQDGSLLSLQESAQFAMDVDLPKLQKSQIQFNQLPQPVQQTIKLEAGPSRLGNLSQSEANGQKLYRVDFNREGIRHELFITPQGKIAAQVQETAFALEPMQNVRSLTLSETPQAVQQAARSNAQGGQVTDVDKATWNGQTVYSVMVDKKSRLSQWIFDQNGKVVESPGQKVEEAAGAENKSQSQSAEHRNNQDQNQDSNQQK